MATFTTIRGDSFPVSASFTGRDLTGWTFACTVKVNNDQADANAVLKVGPRAVTAGEIGGGNTMTCTVGAGYELTFEKGDDGDFMVMVGMIQQAWKIPNEQMELILEQCIV